MALYESLDRRALDAPTASHAAVRQLRQVSLSHRIVAVARLGFVCLLLACWMTGGYAGIVYWSLQSSLLGVIVSAGVSGVGAASTWLGFTELGGR